WSLAVCLIFLAALRRWDELKSAIGNPKTRRALTLSTLLITVNWSIYIWAVAEGRVLEASLGYYINPLLNVALGVLVLKERLS
ncbi:EamA family transporter, partial [Streptomyces brasiliscabiei]|uniref:EamA family transporter n=1 Tax=Streptomyces brasiliscabiei TaxID=2736302 RepID=UPI003015261D